MKEILTEWRKFINESIDPRIQKQLDALIDGGYGIEISEGEARTKIKIVHLDKSRLDQPRGSGFVIIKKTEPTLHGPCFKGWAIDYSKAGENQGLGPLLYEIAIEWASKNGSGLMPDRQEVSDEAWQVWDKYIQRSDVKNRQMDIEDDDGRYSRYYGRNVDRDTIGKLQQITPDIEIDDCDQVQSVQDNGEFWEESPLSKIYRKTNTEVMDALERAKKLFTVKG